MSDVFIGIDPSLTSTGLYILKQKQQKYWQIDTKSKDYVSLLSRCIYIADVILQAIQQVVGEEDDVKLVTIQDYFIGRQQGVVIDLAQLGTIIRYKMLMRDFKIITAAPKKIKKFVTGNGNSTKQQMMDAVYLKWNYKASTDNLADACGMAYFAKYVWGIWNGTQQLSNEQMKFYSVYLNDKCLLKI